MKKFGQKLVVATALAVTTLLPLAQFMKVHAGGIGGAGAVAVVLSNPAVSTATNVTITFVPNTAYATTNVITVGIPAGYTGGAGIVAGDVTVTKTGDANYTSAVASTFTATSFRITLTTAGALNTTNGFTIVVGNNKLTNPATAGNYAFSISVNNTGLDYGMGIASVGGANQVLVTFQVPTTLSFNITTAADANISVFPVSCDLLVGSTAAVNFCQYRLKVATNAANGYTISYSANHGLQRPAPVATLAAASGAVITAGTERYGFNIFAGAITSGGTVTSTVACNTTMANCNQVTGANTQSNFYNAQAASSTTVVTANNANNPGASGDTTNTSLVTHAATVSATTVAGSYDSTLTYNVAANF